MKKLNNFKAIIKLRIVYKSSHLGQLYTTELGSILVSLHCVLVHGRFTLDGSFFKCRREKDANRGAMQIVLILYVAYVHFSGYTCSDHFLCR